MDIFLQKLAKRRILCNIIIRYKQWQETLDFDVWDDMKNSNTDIPSAMIYTPWVSQKCIKFIEFGLSIWDLGVLGISNKAPYIDWIG